MADSPSTGTPRDASEQARQAYAAVARRGMRQYDALQALMSLRAGDAGDVAQAARAADQLARFALTEGWATGPVWVARSAQLLLARWALEHGVTLEEVRGVLASAAPGESDAPEGSAA